MKKSLTYATIVKAMICPYCSHTVEKAQKPAPMAFFQCPECQNFSYADATGNLQKTEESSPQDQSRDAPIQPSRPSESIQSTESVPSPEFAKPPKSTTKPAKSSKTTHPPASQKYQATSPLDENVFPSSPPQRFLTINQRYEVVVEFSNELLFEQIQKHCQKIDAALTPQDEDFYRENLCLKIKNLNAVQTVSLITKVKEKIQEIGRGKLSWQISEPKEENSF